MNIVVIGGGPAGMMAAISASQHIKNNSYNSESNTNKKNQNKGQLAQFQKNQIQKNRVILIEKNDRLGRKLLITGKGRCNITSSLPMDSFFQNIPGNGQFLHSCFSNFTNQDIINFLNSEGLEVKTERGNRIFPVTDKALDVLKCFENKLKEENVEIMYNSRVIDILPQVDGTFKIKLQSLKSDENFKIKLQNSKNDENFKIKLQSSKNDGNFKIKLQSSKDDKTIQLQDPKNIQNQKILYADKVIISTGGKSYPLTGSTGDGYDLAKKLGHTITKIRPSLVPLECYETKMCQELQGLSLKNVQIQIKNIENNKVIYEDFGEMLFTHFGVSGPIILSTSADLVRYKNIDELLKNKKIQLEIDFKPALSEEKLEARVLRDFSEEKNKQFKNSLDKLLPQKLIPVIVKRTGIDPEKKVNEITKSERKNLLNELKHFKIFIRDFRPVDEAIITSGGISIKEINPKTMESKLVPNLYFAGEIIDVDGYTGGFNLQIAYSTGYVAGSQFD